MALTSYVFLSENPARHAPPGGMKLTAAELDDDLAAQATFFLLDGEDAHTATQLLRTVRQHTSNAIYLKPVLLEKVDTSDRLLIEAVDALVAVDSERGIIADGEIEVRISSIQARLQAMQQNQQILGDQQTAFRLLRYMSSRFCTMKPRITSSRVAGYSYPPLEPFFSQDDGSIWSMLALLEEQRMISGAFVTRSYQCVHCRSSFLNFVETCPDCHAEDIKSDSLIHHYRCGYAAAAKEFMQGDEMTCPKCSRHLKQIGVDFDKPSLIFECNECRHVFEEPHVTTVCYHCGRKTDPEHQTQRTIYAYSITALGENAALFGPEQLLNSALGDQLTLFEYAHFRRFVSTEAARIKRYQRSNSSVLMVSIGGFIEAMARLGQRSTELYKELAEVFAHVLRTSDVITTRGQSLFIIMLTETDKASAAIALHRLSDRIEQLFQESLSISAEIRAEAQSVDDNLNLEQLVEVFLQQGSVHHEGKAG